MTCTILFELSAPGEALPTRTRYRVLGITADEFWRMRSHDEAFTNELGTIERCFGTIDFGASRSPAGRTTTWDFCSQEAGDKPAMIEAILELIRRRFGWTIEPK